MKGLIPRTQVFLKQNGSTVLTCAGAIGVIATAVTAVKVTPKAMKLLDKAREEKNDELTKMEVIKIAGPSYIPSISIGAATIGCIFGANVLNKRHQAALTALYSLLNSSYKEYRSKVNETFGENADHKVVNAIAQERCDTLAEKSSGKMRFMDFYSLQIFESTMEDVYNAEDYINKIINERGFVLLSEFYEALGTRNIIDDDDAVGWPKQLLCYHGVDHIAFVHDIINTKSGEECCIITPVVDPIPIYDF